MAGNRHPQVIRSTRHEGGIEIGGDTGGSESSALSSELHDALQMHLRKLDLTFAEPAEAVRDDEDEPAWDEPDFADDDALADEDDDWPVADETRLVSAAAYEGEEIDPQGFVEDDDYADEAEEDDAWVFDRVGLPPRRASDGRDTIPIGAPPLAPEAPLPDWLVARAEERFSPAESGDDYQPHERWNEPAPANGERSSLLRPSMMILTGLLSVGAVGAGVLGLTSSGSQPVVASAAQEMEPVRVATTRATTVVSAPASAPAAASDTVASAADTPETAPSVAVAKVFASSVADGADTLLPSETRTAERKVVNDVRETVSMVTPVDEDVEAKPSAAPALASQAAPRPIKMAGYVNMRSKPQSGSPSITVIPAGATVDLYRCDQWCEVGYAGKRGWVYKSFVGDQAGDAKPADAKTTAKRGSTPAQRVAAERNSGNDDVLAGSKTTAAAKPSPSSESKPSWFQNWKFK